MTVYGIDPAADTFVAVRYPRTHDGPLPDPTTFDNTPEGIAAFRAAIATGDPDALVAVENTGVYSELLCYELHAHAVALVLLDPGAVHRAFPPGPKTDPIDAGRVAEYAHRYADRLAPWAPHAAVVEQVRVLLSTREQLVRQRTATVNTRQSLARKVVQTPGANAALDAVADHLRVQVQVIEDELRRLVGGHPTLAAGVALLVGVPGVGLLLAGHMLVLTAGFTSVPVYRRLAQRLGVAPNAHQSGSSVRGRSRSRGYGSPVVRKLLHLAARSVTTHEAGAKAYYASKVGSGKAKRLVLNNVANRLLRVMCGVLREGVPYRSGHVSVSPALLTSHRQSG